MAHTLGDWTISNCGDFIEAKGEPICQGFDKTEENFPNWEGNRSVLVAAPDLLAACELAANRPSEVQAMMRREGFVIDDLEDRWQKFAFTLYTMLVGNATQAQTAIDQAKGEDGP